MTCQGQQCIFCYFIRYYTPNGSWSPFVRQLPHGIICNSFMATTCENERCKKKKAALNEQYKLNFKPVEK